MDGWMDGWMEWWPLFLSFIPFLPFFLSSSERIRVTHVCILFSPRLESRQFILNRDMMAFSPRYGRGNRSASLFNSTLRLPTPHLQLALSLPPKSDATTHRHPHHLPALPIHPSCLEPEPSKFRRRSCAPVKTAAPHPLLYTYAETAVLVAVVVCSREL